MTKLPILLDGNFIEINRLHPDGMSLVKQTIPLNSTSFEVPFDESPAIGQWLRVYSPAGDEGIYRISQVQKSIGEGDVCQVYAEHAICTLNDDYIPAKEKVEGVSVKNQLKNILNKQTVKKWQLGRCDINDSQTYTMQKSTVLEAFLALVKAYGQDYMLTFDFSTSPWTVNVRAVQTEPSCECRLTRNLQSVKIVADRSEMANKLFLTGYTDSKGKEVTPTYSIQDKESIAKWGTVAVEYTDGYAADNDTLVKHAKIYLKQSKNPLISIAINAVELAQLTGESLDSFGCGKMCRVALPDYGTTENEVITGVAYSDIYGDPTAVTLTLANKLQDASTGLSKLESETSSGSKGSGAGKQTKMLADRYFDATNKIRFAIWGDEDDIDQMTGTRTLYSQLQITRQEISQKVGKSEVSLKDGVLRVSNAVLDVPSIVTQKISTSYLQSKIANMAKVTIQALTCTSIGTNTLTASGSIGTTGSTADIVAGGKLVGTNGLKIGTHTISLKTQTFMTSPQTSKSVKVLEWG